MTFLDSGFSFLVFYFCCGSKACASKEMRMVKFLLTGLWWGRRDKVVKKTAQCWIGLGRIMLTQRIEENRAINQKKPIRAPKINKLMKNAKTLNYFTISIIIIIIILWKIVPHPAKESNGKCRKEIKNTKCVFGWRL